VLNPWNLDALEELEKETGKRVYSILQLRLHPSIIALKNKVEKEFSGKKYEVDLSYITFRGPWYHASWKGDDSKSGGLASNLGIHLFDLLLWIFGDVEDSIVQESKPDKMKGTLELEKAKVNWFLSADKNDLPDSVKNSGKSAYRSIKVNGEEVEFTQGFTDLHTKSYEEILAGRGFGISVVRSSIELVYQIRNAIPRNHGGENFFLKQSISQFKSPSRDLNINPDFFVHPTSFIDNNVNIGKNTKIWHFSHVLPGSNIGKDCVIGKYVEIGPDVSIGNNCKIQNNVSLYKGVTLEDNVFCGPSSVFTNVINPRADVNRRDEFKDTLIKKGATIGANATIVCGKTLGEYSFIGAGSVVTKNVPDYALFAGVPARHIGWVCDCGNVLSKQAFSETTINLTCNRCKNNFRLFEDKLFSINKSS